MFAVTIAIARLFVLPCFYSKFQNLDNDKFIQKVLFKLKHQLKIKCLVLFLSALPFLIEILIIFKKVTLDPIEILKGMMYLYLYFL